MRQGRRRIIGLDPGIARAVEILREHGIRTFTSCEGGPGHSFSKPTVRFFGPPGEGRRVYAIAVAQELPVKNMRYEKPKLAFGLMISGWWEMTFS